MATPIILKKLANNLVLRRSTVDDLEPLAAFNNAIHGGDNGNEYVVAWVKDLLRGNHPTFHVEDFTIIEDEESRQIVSSLNLISQTWSYDGIPFGVGRPELVGTNPDYRNQGLIRAQFDVIHEWSRQRGELVQAITGIPYFYRQFGYEMTVELDGWRAGYAEHLPPVPEADTAEPYRLRKATPEDLPFIHNLYSLSCKRYLLSCVWTESLWEYEFFGKSQKNINRRDLHIIENQAGKAAGFIATPPLLWGDKIAASYFELLPGENWFQATPIVLRYLLKIGQTLTAEDGKTGCKGYRLDLGSEHPAYTAGKSLLPIVRTPYAFYMRVPDLPAFLRYITPVLEERLANSLCAGFSGDLAMSFYRGGIKMIFKEGKLDSVADYKPGAKDKVDAAFPNLTFLHLLFGHRTLDDLRTIYVDAWATDQARLLLDALFPRKPSLIWAVS